MDIPVNPTLFESRIYFLPHLSHSCVPHLNERRASGFAQWLVCLVGTQTTDIGFNGGLRFYVCGSVLYCFYSFGGRTLDFLGLSHSAGFCLSSRHPLEITFPKNDFQKIHSFLSGFFISVCPKLRIVQFI